MTIYSYEDIYSDPKKGIIRDEADANIVGISDDEEINIVCDRKWGEHTSSEKSA